jgi:hypothetical protein
MMRGISRELSSRATWILAAVLAVAACGPPRPVTVAPTAPTPARVLPLVRVIVLETAGPAPSDTSVSFVAGTPRTIVLRHGPPENIVFARVIFSAGAFADSGQLVTVDVQPRPGVYGLDLTTSKPIRGAASVAFDYSRYFSAPERARQVYRSNGAFERALAIGRTLSEDRIELLPTIRPELDNVRAPVATGGRYLLAAPQ